MECVMRFILTVRKNYRNVPYHNWSHAFSVAHAMYTVIKRTKHRFSPNQVGKKFDIFKIRILFF
jgi:cAMP and cAMP-inhibited cGMP 3',5'-cyclic phosphodiesterase 10